MKGCGCNAVNGIAASRELWGLKRAALLKRREGRSKGVFILGST